MSSQISSPLLAVLLVTSSSRGPSLSFRYPRKPKIEKRYSKVRYLVTKDHDSVQDLDNQNLQTRSAEGTGGGSNTPNEIVDPMSGVGLQEDEMNDDFDADSTLSEDLDQGSASDSSSSSDDDDAAASDVDGIGGGDEGLSDAESIQPNISRKEDAEVASSVGTSAATREATATIEAEEQARRRKRAYEKYIGYDCDTLASLLAPKRELCHQKFELVIDDLAFVGHPVCVDKDGNWLPEQSEGGLKTRKESFSGYRIGSPDPFAIDPSRTSTTANTPPMTLFHFVLVLDRPDPSPDLPTLDLTSWLQIFYDNIAFKMTAALFAEEIRCNYVSGECEKIGSLRERCMDDGQSYSAFLTHANHLSSLARSIQQVYLSISLSSNAFVTINESIDAHLQLPPMLHDPSKMMKMSEIETPIDVNDPLFTTAKMTNDGVILPPRPITADQLMHEEWSRTTGPFLLPWKTLLLLRENHEEHDNDDGIDEVGSDLAPYTDKGIEAWARKFTSLMKPTLDGIPTLADAADLLGWNLEQDVYPMVRHLIYYREARVIDVPRIQNYYAVSPLFNLGNLAKLSTSWSIRFLYLPPLPSFLATLSSALKPFSMQIVGRDQKQMCLDALIWLLRHEVIVQMHVRLRLVANEVCKRKAAIARDAERQRIKRKRALIAKRKAREAAIQKESEKPSNSEDKANLKLPELLNLDLSQSAPIPSQIIDRQNSILKLNRGRTIDRSLSPSSVDTPQSTSIPIPVGRSALSATRPGSSGEGVSPSPKTSTSLATKLATIKPTNTPPPPSNEATSTTYYGGELRFERRPVLRSRSPSRTLALTSTNTLMGGTSGSFGALRSGGGGSRPGTPRGRGRTRAHSREPGSSTTGGGSKESTNAIQITNQQKKNSKSNLPSALESKGIVASLTGANRMEGRRRSPSQARLRVTGFGDDEEVYMNQQQPGEMDKKADSTGGSSARTSLSHDDRRSLREEMRRLSLVDEEKEFLDKKNPLEDKKQTLNDPNTTLKETDLEEEQEEDESDLSEDEELYLNYDIEFDEWETQPIASIISEPGRASGDENEWIAAMVEGKEVWQTERLYKLLPFLNGKHTVDEIVYRLEWRRKDLRAVLAAFREDIITFVHP